MHVLIIGAGASGLMAARLLAEQKYQVTIVEARDRIGGRIHTLNTGFSLPMEAGAEFIHGDLPVTLAVLKELKGVRTLLKGNRYQFWKGKWQTGNPLEKDWNELDHALKKLETDTDMASFLKQHFDQEQYADLYERVKGYVEGYDIADLDRVSALALRDEWEESDEELQYHLRGGYIRLVSFLEERIKAAGGSILLSSPVKEIHWETGKVKLVTDNGAILEADKVIVTVPLGVLQKGMIRFTPSLTEQEKAYHQIGFGGVIKFLFEFRTPFWEDQIPTPLKEVAFIFSDAEVPTWWTQLPDKTPLLTGWLGGPAAFTIASGKEALYKKAVESLQTIFNYPVAEIEKQLLNWYITDWINDPYAQGAYAYTTVDTPSARKLLASPVHDTIYFAGEALYEGTAMGTVEAALASGKEVAEKIRG